MCALKKIPNSFESPSPATLKIELGAQEGSAGAPLGPLVAQFFLDISETVTIFNELSSIYVEGVPVTFVVKIEEDFITFFVQSPSCSSFIEQILLEKEFKITLLDLYNCYKIFFFFHKHFGKKACAFIFFSSLSCFFKNRQINLA